MLVYCNELFLNPPDGLTSILICVARWLGEKSKSFVDPEQLRQSCRLRLNDGSYIESVTNQLQPSEPKHPILLCVKLTHGDEVPGRQWVTEIGIERQKEGAPFRCTVVLKTDEISPRVTAPISVTRPRLITSLIQTCNPVPSTPGITLQALTEDTADLFADLIEDQDRMHALIIVSPTNDGQYLIDIDRLKSVVAGLAQTLVIPRDEDTHAISDIAGAKYCAWRGAIKVIFPARSQSDQKFYEVQTLYPDDLATAFADNRRAEQEVLSLITHRTNLPLSWAALSFAKVTQARLQAEFKASQQGTTGHSDSTKNDEMLALAFAEIDEKDNLINGLQSKVLDQDNELRRVEFELESVKHALAKKTDSPAIARECFLTEAARNALKHVRFEGGSVEQALLLIGELFSDRIVVLDAAVASAKRSAIFKYSPKAYELLFALATDYWTLLSGGTGNHQAKDVFGSSFAARESKSLSKDGKTRRTFKYNGDDIEMMQHLKIGTADNAADTLRIHFHWDAAERLIVIGYCGPHLDF